MSAGLAAAPPAPGAAEAGSPPAEARGRKLLSLRGVSKIFGNGTLAINGVDLDLRQGEFVSLLGPSGCGKSTLLRIIAGLGRATTGTVDWPSSTHDARGAPEPALGFVFQEPTLMPWATALRNVMLPLVICGTPKREAEPRAAAMLALVGLAGFENAYPRELSGGMKMRVSIARGLVTKPKVLLMDEPFGALDEFTRNKLDADLVDLWWRRSLTVLFVTHSIYEAVFLSTRVVVMAARPGRIFAELAIDEPHPRGEAFRMSPRFAEHCRALSRVLTDASLASDGPRPEGVR